MGIWILVGLLIVAAIGAVLILVKDIITILKWWWLL
jgi:hypothetical protein